MLALNFRLPLVSAARLALVTAVLCLHSPRGAAQPITATWIGATGNWTNPALWSTNPNYPNNGTPPGTTYHAVLNGPAANSVTVGVIYLQQLTLQSGTITGSGALFVNGPTAWSGGTIAAATPPTGWIDLFLGTTTVSGATSTSGLVRMYGNATVSGTVSVNGGLLDFMGAMTTITPAGSITGTGGGGFATGNAQAVVNGTYNVSGLTAVGGLMNSAGRVDFNGPTTMGSLSIGGRFTSPTVGGTAPIVVTSDLYFFDGSLIGSGAVTVGGNARFGATGGLMQSPSDVTVTGRTLILNGVNNTIGPYEYSGPLTIHVGGGGRLVFGAGSTTTLVTGFEGFTNSPGGLGTITNAGTLTGSGGQMSVGPGIIFDNVGVVNTGSSGMAVAGTLTGTGLVNGALRAGVIAPGGTGAGTLRASAQMFLSRTFQAELLGPTPSAYDRLDVTGGTIDLGVSSSLSTLLGYAPAPTDSLTIIFGGPVTGTFVGLPNGSRFVVGSFGGTAYFADITYNSNSIVLSNLRPVPEPAAWLLVGGAAFAWGWRRKALAVRARDR